MDDVPLRGLITNAWHTGVWRELHHTYVSQSQRVPSLGLDHQGPHPDNL